MRAVYEEHLQDWPEITCKLKKVHPKALGHWDLDKKDKGDSFSKRQ